MSDQPLAPSGAKSVEPAPRTVQAIRRGAPLLASGFVVAAAFLIGWNTPIPTSFMPQL